MAANRWRLDVARIEQNLDAVLAHLKPESLEVYSFLRARFAEGDIANDGLFQFLFRSFYRLDNAGLSDDFKQDFFRLMQ